MMFGRYHCIFGSTFFYQIHPSLGSYLEAVKPFFLLHVFIIGQVVVKEGPASDTPLTE